MRQPSAVRPLSPRPGRTLEHQNKPTEPALEIVRNALLGLRAEPKAGADRKADRV